MQMKHSFVGVQQVNYTFDIEPDFRYIDLIRTIILNRMEKWMPKRVDIRLNTIYCALVLGDKIVTQNLRSGFVIVSISILL